MTDITRTQCPYCGVGCGLEVAAPAAGKATNRDEEGTPVWKVKGDKAHPSSRGMVCVKGATVAESIDKSRPLYPTAFIEIHPRDANRLGIEDDTLVEVQSSRGSSHFQQK